MTGSKRQSAGWGIARLCGRTLSLRPAVRRLFSPAIISAILMAAVFVFATSGIQVSGKVGQQDHAASVAMADEAAQQPHADHGSTPHKADHSHDVPALHAIGFDMTAFPSRPVWDGELQPLSGRSRSKLKKPPRA